MNFTYVLIVVVIIIAIIHLYKINNNETFKILSEEQNVGSHNVFINSMEQIIFSTINKNLKTLFDEKANKDSMPDLSVIAYSGETAPNGWQLCDGANLEYKDSNPYKFFLDNTGNPIKTPDLRGRFILGANPVKINGTTENFDRNIRNINENGGEETHKLSEGEMPRHSHQQKFAGGIKDYNKTWTGTGLHVQYWQDHHLGVFTADAGSDVAHNNMPPFYVLTYIIKKPSQSSQSSQSL
jgi:microcystin-dependent protein